MDKHLNIEYEQNASNRSGANEANIQTDRRALQNTRFVDFPQQSPAFDNRSGHVGFVVDKVALALVSLSAFVSPANSHSTNYSTLVNRPMVGAIAFRD
jgi:hypothetical protein